jgi:hypothetical protein
MYDPELKLSTTLSVMQDKRYLKRNFVNGEYLICGIDVDYFKGQKYYKTGVMFNVRLLKKVVKDEEKCKECFEKQMM